MADIPELAGIKRQHVIKGMRTCQWPLGFSTLLQFVLSLVYLHTKEIEYYTADAPNKWCTDTSIGPSHLPRTSSTLLTCCFLILDF